MKEAEVTILGETWYATAMSDRDYTELYAEDDGEMGETDTDLYTITFNRDKLTLRVVIHELVHAYLSMCCVEHTAIDKASFEEIVCDLFGKYGKTIVEQAEKLLKELQ